MSTRQLLGCSTREYSFYIIGKLRDGMTLANYGVVWNLDHIIPIMLRDADGNRPDQATIISRFHFTNVEPVLIEEHREKTIAERVARWRPPPPQRPVRHLTDDEFDELMEALGIEM
jgi:integrase